MLLTGPPGLGKTTLAHVLARQAGYQVHEVNASDDRTGKVVEERIRNALESRALSGSGGMTGNKPTCVVVDEVDGAGGGGDSVSLYEEHRRRLSSRVHFLELCEDAGQARDRRKHSEKAQRSGEMGCSDSDKSLTSCAGKGKGKKDRPLLRPIICICNDL